MKFINALVVKLVDTKDLKSLPFWECQLSLAEGTTEMIKPLVFCDNNIRSKKIRNFVIKNIKKNLFIKKNLVIVIGGDGFMLKILKRYKNSKKIFYGINSGNYGFLMNKFSYKKTIKNLSKAKTVSISPLEMRVTNKSGKIKRSIAINEISVLRQSRQTASLSIKIGKKY